MSIIAGQIQVSLFGNFWNFILLYFLGPKLVKSMIADPVYERNPALKELRVNRAGSYRPAPAGI